MSSEQVNRVFASSSPAGTPAVPRLPAWRMSRAARSLGGWRPVRSEKRMDSYRRIVASLEAESSGGCRAGRVNTRPRDQPSGKLTQRFTQPRRRTRKHKPHQTVAPKQEDNGRAEFESPHLLTLGEFNRRGSIA